MCTLVYPAARHTDHDPGEIVKRTWGNDESLVVGSMVWNCFNCYAYYGVCLVNNSPCELNQILRQKYGKNKLKITPFSTYSDSFLELRFGSIPNEFFDNLLKDYEKEWLELKVNLDDINEELGLVFKLLPEKDVKDINKILEKTGFTKNWKEL